MQPIEFKYKQYIGSVGYYASIKMHVEETISPGLQIDFNEEFVDREWQIAIGFGVNYFYEHFSKYSNNGIRIKVDYLHTMTEDTSLAIVFFVTIKCISLNFPLDRELIHLNDMTGSFCFLK
jgi:hypothetical protein